MKYKFYGISNLSKKIGGVFLKKFHRCFYWIKRNNVSLVYLGAEVVKNKPKFNIKSHLIGHWTLHLNYTRQEDAATLSAVSHILRCNESTILPWSISIPMVGWLVKLGRPTEQRANLFNACAKTRLLCPTETVEELLVAYFECSDDSFVDQQWTALKKKNDQLFFPFLWNLQVTTTKPNNFAKNIPKLKKSINTIYIV